MNARSRSFVPPSRVVSPRSCPHVRGMHDSERQPDGAGQPPVTPACFDCPAHRQAAFSDLRGATAGACPFERVTLEQRAPIPDDWRDVYALGLVRRGVLVRQRVDRAGCAIAVDAAGPGCLIPFGPTGGALGVRGYAATRVLVCLLRTEVLQRALATLDSTAPDLLRLQREALERVELIAHARGRACVDERVAALLVALSDTLAPPRLAAPIPSGLQQRDMAALLGVRHESVCRTLRKLERQGVIERDADGIRILDRDALETV